MRLKHGHRIVFMTALGVIAFVHTTARAQTDALSRLPKSSFEAFLLLDVAGPSGGQRQCRAKLSRYTV